MNRRTGTERYMRLLMQYPISGWSNEELLAVRRELVATSPDAESDRDFLSTCLKHVEEEIWKRQAPTFCDEENQ